MDDRNIVRPESFRADLIAPCGLNCGVCIAHLRARNSCPGCNADDAKKPKTRVICRIKLCDELRGRRFCFECAEFPCSLLLRLDKRYRTKYGVSVVENLETVENTGLEAFVIRERTRWKCPGCGGVVCMHKPACIYCGRKKS